MFVGGAPPPPPPPPPFRPSARPHTHPRVRVAAPVVTRSLPANGPAAGGATLTVSGNNFGSDSGNQLVSIDGRQCTMSSWVSTTSMRCEVAAEQTGVTGVAKVLNVGTGATARYAFENAGVLEGTLLSAFTYDGALGCCGFRRDDRCACNHQGTV